MNPVSMALPFFVKSVLKVSECCWMSTRQLFANLTSGKEKQNRRGANRKGTQDHFHALGKNLYLSISFLTCLPLRSLPHLLFLLLLPHQLLSLFHPAGRNKRVHTTTPSSTVSCCLNFWGAKIKVAFRCHHCQGNKKKLSSKGLGGKSGDGQGEGGRWSTCTCKQGV